MAIHPTAIIDPEAKIGRDVEIGPYAVIEGDTEIGDNCFIDSHVKICRYTTLGAGCRVYLGAFIGCEPQDHRLVPGVRSFTRIGAGTILREYVTVHRSPFVDGETVIGENSLLMAFVHVGHDAIIGNRVTIANQTAISGHVRICDGAVLSGFVLIHQFCRIGELAMIHGRTTLVQDVPPYCMVAANDYICGANTIGLRRAGVDSPRRLAIHKAIKKYFFQGLNGRKALAEIASEEMTDEVKRFVQFISESTRGITSADRQMLNEEEQVDG